MTALIFQTWGRRQKSPREIVIKEGLWREREREREGEREREPKLKPGEQSDLFIDWFIDMSLGSHSR